MTAGSYRAPRRRSHAESDAGRSLALAMVGAGGSGLLAIATLLSGGGFLAAFLVHVLAGSAIVPLLAVAPLARAPAAAARRRLSERRVSRHPADVAALSAGVSRAG